MLEFERERPRRGTRKEKKKNLMTFGLVIFYAEGKEFNLGEIFIIRERSDKGNASSEREEKIALFTAENTAIQKRSGGKGASRAKKGGTIHLSFSPPSGEKVKRARHHYQEGGGEGLPSVITLGTLSLRRVNERRSVGQLFGNVKRKKGKFRRGKKTLAGGVINRRKEVSGDIFTVPRIGEEGGFSSLIFRGSTKIWGGRRDAGLPFLCFEGVPLKEKKKEKSAVDNCFRKER